MLLTTTRLLLRELTPEDFGDFLAYQNDPGFLKACLADIHNELEIRALIRQAIDGQNEQPRRRFQLGIALREDFHLIGSCGLRKEKSSDRIAEFQVELSPSYWKRGIAAEAGRTILRFAFTELRLHRIWATTPAVNSQAVRLLVKLGFKLEGRLRHHIWAKSQWHDTLQYGYLDFEYIQ
jgi:[ribosomal protein S5]-alanine N-acetyltransferase